MYSSYFQKVTESRLLNTDINLISINKGVTLFKQGETIEYIYFVIQGELSILKDNQKMWQARKDEFVGISSFFIGDPNYSYEVVAKENSEIIKMPLQVFAEAVEKSSALNQSLMKSFCKRIKITLDKVVSFSKQPQKVIKSALM